jgi:predicted metal-binding protein
MLVWFGLFAVNPARCHCLKSQRAGCKVASPCYLCPGSMVATIRAAYPRKTRLYATVSLTRLIRLECPGRLVCNHSRIALIRVDQGGLWYPAPLISALLPMFVKPPSCPLGSDISPGRHPSMVWRNPAPIFTVGYSPSWPGYLIRLVAVWFAVFSRAVGLVPPCVLWSDHTGPRLA